MGGSDREWLGRSVVLWLVVVATLCEHAHALHEGMCDDPVNAALPFCDASREIDARVDDLVARIPLTAVGGLLINNATSVMSKNPPLHVHAYEWWNEALHGVGVSPGVHFQAPTPHATSFPQVLSVAASFNRTLFHAIGQAISIEARAFYNVGHGGLTYWAPNINIFRDPRWGRGQETPGEDPMLTSAYAVAFVRGLQGDPINGTRNFEPRFLKLSATCKHFSSYSQEVPRHRNDAIVTLQDQQDTYLPAFQACVQQARASGVMCSYNAVNGIPSCADRGLLTDLVRGQWQLDGYIVSDCAAIHDILYEHHYTQSPTKTCATTLNAGVDLNCGQFFKEHLVRALAEGDVERDTVRRAMKKLFRVQMRLGMFEKRPQPFAEITPEQVDSPGHRQLALEAARQSIVLLKNDNNLLPLDASAFLSNEPLTIALVGPHANASEVLLGNYAGIPATISTPLDAISRIAKNVSYAIGCNVSSSSSGDLPDFAQAVKVAASADQVVVFVGLNQDQEREGIDRTSLYLPGYQRELIDKMIRASSKPIVLVVISGGCVDLSSYKYHPKVGAIVYAGYPGQAGGQAIADVLFGKFNPTGRLTQTFYAQEFVETTSIYDMHMRPYEPTGNPGRTHRFYTGAPVFAFGHGLSYTTFRVSISVATAGATTECEETASPAWSSQLSVTVTNTGDRPGEYVVLVFAEPPPPPRSLPQTHDGYSKSDGAEVRGGQPLQKLVAFTRTQRLAPDATQVVEFSFFSQHFALADAHGQWVLPAQGTWVLRVEDQRVELFVSSHRICTSSNRGDQDDDDQQAIE